LLTVRLGIPAEIGLAGFSFSSDLGVNVDVKPIPGLEHLPYAEVWLHTVDHGEWRAAAEQARVLGKDGLEVWTTTRTPDVAAALEAWGYQEVRRYVISELDVVAASQPQAPAFEMVTLAERPELADALYEIALESYPDQPGRAETRIGEDWYEWGLRSQDPESVLVALEGGEPLGYISLAFLAVARPARGRGVAGALKRAQVTWAKQAGVDRLRVANEVRLEGMLALNRRLGYVPLYEEIVLRGPIYPLMSTG
jgi:GNAT superfamily N-acetyltransferase